MRDIEMTTCELNAVFKGEGRATRVHEAYNDRGQLLWLELAVLVRVELVEAGAVKDWGVE